MVKRVFSLNYIINLVLRTPYRGKKLKINLGDENI